MPPKYTAAQKRAYAKRKNKKQPMFIGRKKARPMRKAIKYNQEVKSLESKAGNLTLTHSVGSAVNGPSDSLIFLPSWWSNNDATAVSVRGLGSDEVIGDWITPAYPLKSKFTIDFQSITVLQSGQFPSVNINMVTGYLQSTGAKENARQDSIANWKADCLTAVKRELYESNFDSDFTSFTQKNRRIKITGNTRIRPYQGPAVQVQVDNTSIMAPDRNVTSTHNLPKFKTRLQNVGAQNFVPNSLWIPFTMFILQDWDAAGGTLPIREISKVYYTDS